MTDYTKPTAVIFEFPPTAAALATDRHSRNRRLFKLLYRSTMPISPRDALVAGTMGAAVSAMWWRLTAWMWLHGPVPDDPAALAMAAGVTRAQWERHRPALEHLLERDADGAWINRPLAQARDMIEARFFAVDAAERNSPPPCIRRETDAGEDDELPPLTISFAAELAAQIELTPIQMKAWRALLLHLAHHGRLPRDRKSLAQICDLRVGSFTAMASALALHFDLERDGRWTHEDVIAGRGDRPVHLVEGAI